LKSLLAIVVAILMVFTVFLVITPAVAAPNEKANDNAKSGPVVSIPENAKKISDHVYYLGKSKDVDGTTIEGFAFVYKDKAHPAKPPGTPGKGPDKGNGDGDTGDVQCFRYIGGEWNLEMKEGWDFYTANSRGMNQTNLFGNFTDDVQKWENEVADGNILNDGNRIDTVFPGIISSADPNAIFFGDIDSEGAIAVTFVWTTVGKPSLREIRAFDMVFDQVDYNWSNNAPDPADANTMDFNNIAMHELGHAIGMDHPKDGSCTEETMWRSAFDGETKKRSLHDGDKEGIAALYEQ